MARGTTEPRVGISSWRPRTSAVVRPPTSFAGTADRTCSRAAPARTSCARGPAVTPCAPVTVRRTRSPAALKWTSRPSTSLIASTRPPASAASAPTTAEPGCRGPDGSRCSSREAACWRSASPVRRGRSRCRIVSGFRLGPWSARHGARRGSGRRARSAAGGAAAASLTADIADGAIRLSQRASRRPRTTLRLAGGGFARCTAAARRARLTIRSARLIVRRGPLSVRGRFSDVAARAATLVVTDRCDGTLTRVVNGRARVRDPSRARSVTLRRGGRHLARGRPRR
jgi:hypothetical protein